MYVGGAKTFFVVFLFIFVLSSVHVLTKLEANELRFRTTHSKVEIFSIKKTPKTLLSARSRKLSVHNAFLSCL